MGETKPKVLRCAIYTRKSSEEGLEQDFNSLQAQREACAAFIKSQHGEGWRTIADIYDDGGFSGGNMNRPALQRLLADIAGRRIDVVVVYKVDRLTRSLSDFAKMVEIFDAHRVSFVAMTQQFNTTTSMGRLTLNVLLSFAQFEREVTGERIRDKIAASKKKGMWMGGTVPLGYEVRERRLAINEAEATVVRNIFRTYVRVGSVRLLKRELDRRDISSKVRISAAGSRSGGRPFSRGALYALLSNPVYLGEIRHKELRYPGRHKPLVDRPLWDAVQALLSTNAAFESRPSRTVTPSPLAGKLYDESGNCLTSVHSKKGHRRYRYYVSRFMTGGGAKERRDGWRLPALEIERAVISALDALLNDDAALGGAALEAEFPADKVPSLVQLARRQASLLKSASDARPLRSLVHRVDLKPDGILISARLADPDQHLNQEFPRELVVTRLIPMRIKKRGVELRLVLQGSTGPARRDLTLLRAIARGRQWFDELVSGTAESISAISRRESLAVRHVSRIIRLAFLAPDVIETILDGRQPPQLTAQELLHRRKLPAVWSEQRRILAAS